jgi:hypothetical protein
VLALAATVAPAVPALAATKSSKPSSSGGRTKPAAAAAKSKAPSAAVRAEIENQKKYVARALETIRKHPLPTGSEPAFVFVPVEPGHRPGEHEAPHASKAGGSGATR